MYQYFRGGQDKLQIANWVQNVDCRPGTKCRLQTGYKLQTADQVQNADCRPGTKCRLQTGYKMQTADWVQMQTADPIQVFDQPQPWIIQGYLK